MKVILDTKIVNCLLYWQIDYRGLNEGQDSNATAQRNDWLEKLVFA